MDRDNECMARLGRGDLSALEELIGRNRGDAEKYARSILHDDALAEDVVQEAFARVYLTRASYQPTFAFRTWLTALVRNLCIDQLRRQKRAPLPMEELPDRPVPSAEAEFLRSDRRMRLLSRLAGLPETDRELLTGYALDGLSYRELAERTGLSAAQVKIRLHRLRRKLRREEDVHDE